MNIIFLLKICFIYYDLQENLNHPDQLMRLKRDSSHVRNSVIIGASAEKGLLLEKNERQQEKKKWKLFYFLSFYLIYRELEETIASRCPP